MGKVVVKQVKKSVIMQLEWWISKSEWTETGLEGQVGFYQWEEKAV